MAPRVGSEFAGYRIDALLGRGGMSVVYRAENPRLGNKVALKVLASDLAEDDRFRERFVRESRIAASLNHPNVIPIYDADEADGLLYIAMRYVEGGDLNELLRREGPLRLERTILIFSQIGSALDVAHSRGLIHRDIKPANILLEMPPGAAVADHVYVSDFGVAKHRSSRSGLTGTREWVGTLDYLAPEQLEGVQQVDGRVDVYSMGCLLYACMTCRVPYERENEYAVMLAHMNDAPPRLCEIRPDLPPRIDAVLARAMAKSPDERYPTALEFVSDLKGLLDPASQTRLAAWEGAVPRTVVAQPLRAEPSTEHDSPLAGPSGSPPVASPPVGPPGQSVSGGVENGGGGPRRGRLTAAALAGALLLVAAGGAAAATYFLTRDSGEKSVKATTTASGKTTGMTHGSNTGDMSGSGLAELVPAPVWKHCSMVSASAGADEQASCMLPADNGGAKDAILYHYANHKSLAAGYQTREAAARVPRNKGACNGVDWGGERAWYHGPGEVGGRYFCYFKAGQAFVVWTVDVSDVLGEASRDDTNHALLFNWWRFWHHRVGGL